MGCSFCRRVGDDYGFFGCNFDGVNLNFFKMLFPAELYGSQCLVEFFCKGFGVNVSCGNYKPVSAIDNLAVKFPHVFFRNVLGGFRCNPCECGMGMVLVYVVDHCPAQDGYRVVLHVLHRLGQACVQHQENFFFKLGMKESVCKHVQEGVKIFVP